MASLKFDAKLETVTLRNSSGTTYYQPWAKERWEELKTILRNFGIILSSPYELEFVDDNYLIQSVPKFFGATNVNVLYKDKVIAKGCVDGSNYCDKEGLLTIYMDVLESIYEIN